MSAFTDQVDGDVSLIFLNSEEFAEVHNLNGVECVCIIQSPTTQEKILTADKYSGYEGIHGEILIVHVKQSELEELPEERMPIEGQIFKVDEAIYQVESCTAEIGLLTITLTGNIGG
ncbi:MAG: hypothetical protein IJ728_03175 [Selenomonadaceae bacterium]|nr:hypothetical protein [Selenomonadaceae bacterium]